jgi:hypothetical protein
LLLVLQAAVKPAYMGWVAAARPQLAGAGAEEAFRLFTGDLLRLLLLVAGLYGAAILALKRSAPAWVLLVAVALAASLELNYLIKDNNLINPTPPQQMQNYLQADDVVQFLQQQPKPFRIFPLTQGRNPDWYMPHQIESIVGYTGAKPRLYQEAVDALSYNNPNFLRLMNATYFISDQPIHHEDFEEVFVGRQERVYRFKQAFPRAFLTNEVITVAPAQALEYYKSPGFNFARVATIETPLSGAPQADATGQVTWVKHDPDNLELIVETTGPMFLVVTDNYYPSGWKAAINGAPTSITKTNFMFRGILVPAGKSRVTMTFEPLSAGKGNIFKCISLLLLIAAGLATMWLGRMRKAPASSRE